MILDSRKCLSKKDLQKMLVAPHPAAPVVAHDTSDVLKEQNESAYTQ
jgi:hypothetical protein